jgi:hypothetical protein
MNKTAAKPLLVAHFPATAGTHKARWKEMMDGINEIIAQYESFGLPKIKDTNELYRLINDTELFVYDKQTGGGVAVVGDHGSNVKTNKQAGMKLVSKPAGYDDLAKAIKDFAERELHSYTAIRFSASTLKEDFCYKDGVLSLSQKRHDKLNDAGNCYARTEKGQAISKFLDRVSAALIEEGAYKYVPGRHEEIVKAEQIMYLLQISLDRINIKTGKVMPLTGDTDVPNPSLKADIGD